MPAVVASTSRIYFVPVGIPHEPIPVYQYWRYCQDGHACFFSEAVDLIRIFDHYV